LYCDGHVKWKNVTSVNAGDFGLKPATSTVTDDDGAPCLEVDTNAVS